jgi:signal transduction histidine kinase
MKLEKYINKSLGGYMLKWILKKGLKFQITLILILVLSIPIAALVWNYFVPNKVGTTVKTMQTDRLAGLLELLDSSIDKGSLYNINGSNNNLLKAEDDISSKFSSLAKTLRGTSIGIYINSNINNVDKSHVMEFHSPMKESVKAEYIMGFNESLNDSLQSKNDKTVYLKYNNREILVCFHPIIYNNTVVAVEWADTLMPEELYYGKSLFMYLSFLVPISFTIGFILVLLVVNNSNNNILKIRKGLHIMSNDLSYRIENMGGDFGNIVESINSMADSLEAKEKLEEQLQRAEKLASLGQMISGIAHEIRNPLGIIRGTVQLMEKNFKNVEGLQEYVNIVKEQSDRENKVIQELLDYARPAKKVLCKMNINTLINQVLFFTNKYIQDNHVKLTLQLQQDITDIMIDCDKIKQVFVNLIINACEAMESGGSLTIETKTEGNLIKISFKDTGTGMDEKQMKNLFNPYYTTKPRGTGLGLAISNGIVEMHGGHIEVFSKTNEGSTFIVALPNNNEDGDIIG